MLNEAIVNYKPPVPFFLFTKPSSTSPTSNTA